MGNVSNKSYYENNPLFVVCDAGSLQSQYHKHQNNSKIIDFLKEVPFETNYKIHPFTYVTEINSSNNYYYQKGHFSLYFHLEAAKFHPKSKIILTKQHYKEITDIITM